MAGRGIESKVDRRRFLEASAGLLVSGACILTSCAPRYHTLRGELDGATITLDRKDVPELDVPGGMVRIQAAGIGAPLVVRRTGNGQLLAVLTLCTHKGCHVQPMPRSFECPCHGSRFFEDGSVQEGPAAVPLRRFPLRETETAIMIEVTP